jgi:hypothetical protein
MEETFNKPIRPVVFKAILSLFYLWHYTGKTRKKCFERLDLEHIIADVLKNMSVCNLKYETAGISQIESNMCF